MMYYACVSDKRQAFYGNPRLFDGWFDNSQRAEKAAIDFCIESAIPPWAAIIDVYNRPDVFEMPDW